MRVHKMGCDACQAHIFSTSVGCAIYTYPGGIAKDAELAYNEPWIGKRRGFP